MASIILQNFLPKFISIAKSVNEKKLAHLTGYISFVMTSMERAICCIFTIWRPNFKQNCQIFFSQAYLACFFKYIGLSKDTFFWSHLMLVDYTLRNLGQQCLKLNIFKCKSLISKPLCHMQWCIFYYPEYSKSYV